MNYPDNTLLIGNVAVPASADGRERFREATAPSSPNINVSESPVLELLKSGNSRQVSKVKDAKNAIPLHKEFRKRVESISHEAATLADLDEEAFSNSWAGASAQIDDDLERLYDMPWGDGDSLKKAIAVVQGIVGNAVWTKKHAKYVAAVAIELKAEYEPSRELAVKISRMATEFDLDRFRGTVTEAATRKTYMLVERVG